MDNYFDAKLNSNVIDENLSSKQNRESGKLKIFFGYATGVGKTYAMLDEAQEQLKSGKNVLVGYVESHTQPETLRLFLDMPTLAPKIISYDNREWKEFDLDEALRLDPQLIVVDELEHNNAPGVRNRKRFQDIEELLNAGIDVYTSVNVQHIESLNDVISDITNVHVQETVPDYIFERADMITLVDIEPDELLRRLEKDKIYKQELTQTTMKTFYSRENLRLLREIAMRKAADRISNENQNERLLSEKMANTKLLVCIGTSPSSARCIRWTARAAKAFHAPWIALYVEDIKRHSLTKGQQATLFSNMDLVEKLGAETITIIGHDIAKAVSEYAKLSGITNIVIGKSRNKKSLRNLFVMDFEDKLISLLPNIEVYIIPENIVTKKYKNKTLKYTKFSLKKFLLMIGLLGITSIVCFGFQIIGFAQQNIVSFYILSVLIISMITQEYWYGIFASIISVLIYSCLFTEPYYTFHVLQPESFLNIFVLSFVAFITSILTVSIKSQARFAVERERRTKVLYEINKKLLITRGATNIAALTNEYIINLFERSVIFYLVDPVQGGIGITMQAKKDKNVSFFNSKDEIVVAHWVFLNKKRAGAGTDTLMEASAFYMPVISQGEVFAVVGISCNEGVLDQDTRQFLRMIASQVAMALEKQHLSDEQRSIIVEVEKEKTRSNLLRAIAHDLRTPLSGILGASSAIRENRFTLDESTREKLNADIQEEAQWLIRMVENLLSVTRINENESKVSKAPEAAEEVIAEAVNRIQKRFPQQDILVRVPDELLEVPMDGTLIVQVLINLLENAIKHSKNTTPVEVLLMKDGEKVLFEVRDHGKGIAKEDFPYLFTSYVPNGVKSSDSSRGMGIGLSICMTIIKAHNGTMEASNHKEGGAVFRFSLPL